MSRICSCAERVQPVEKRNWGLHPRHRWDTAAQDLHQREIHPRGWRPTVTVICLSCGAAWRTNVAYTAKLQPLQERTAS